MMDWLLIISNIAAGGLRCIVCYYLISRLLTATKPEKKGVLAVLGGIVVISLMLPVTGLSEVYRMALETVLVTVSASRFQRTELRMSLFVGIFYELAVSFWQFLFAAWMGVFFGSSEFLDFETGNGQIAVWVWHLLLFLLAWIVWRCPNMTGRESFRFISVAVVAGFLAVITLSEQTALIIADDTLDMWTIMSVVLMMSVLVFNMRRQYETEKELAKLKSEQTELLERDYNTLNQAYAINAKLFHDFHNHIGVLRQLLLHKKMEQAMQYLDELQAPVQEMADTVCTGDETVDYLINSKAATAKVSDIRFQLQVEFPRHTNLRSADLCTILGNLLDNALEAAKQIEAPERRLIQLTIRRINQMLVIKVENSFANAPVEKDGVYMTSKNEGGLHGWGLKSARAAAGKYDGMVQTSYAGNMFKAVVTLSFQGVEAGTGDL